MDEAFAQELEAVDWFSSCGQPLSVSLPFSIVQVGGWVEAIERCSDQSWEDTTLEARNRLTEFLCAQHHDEYLGWNTITDAAKARVVTPLMNRVWQPFAERHGFSKLFVDTVAWDVLAAIMEHEYQNCHNRPEFFLPLMRVYHACHFPCGWSGEWPVGHLFAW